MSRVLTPYARSMGIEVADERGNSDAPVLALSFHGNVEGRPGVLHGGATSGLLETAGYAALWAELERTGRKAQLKPINITVQFLSAAKKRTTYAVGRVTRAGRRNASITVEAWQDDRSRPVATAVMNVLMAGED